MTKTLEKKITKLLENKGPMTRADMVNQLGVPRTTIYDSLKVLIDQSEVNKYPVNNSARGRPKVFFEVASS